jgi:hypothetical protein
MAAEEPTLSLVLENPSLERQFEAFLNEYLCEENLLFWRATKNYNQIDESERQKLAVQVWNEFISNDAPHVISISATQRRLLQGTFMTARPNLFDEPRSMIFRLMNDSFPQFLDWLHQKDAEKEPIALIAGLNSDVLLLILKYMDCETLIVSACVCRSWSKTLDEEMFGKALFKTTDYLSDPYEELSSHKS